MVHYFWFHGDHGEKKRKDTRPNIWVPCVIERTAGRLVTGTCLSVPNPVTGWDGSSGGCLGSGQGILGHQRTMLLPFLFYFHFQIFVFPF